VPRAWTTYFAEMADTELPDELPGSWIERAELELGASVPVSFSDRLPLSEA